MEAHHAARALATETGGLCLAPLAPAAVDFDIEGFVACLRSQATPEFVPSRCLHFVHSALQAAGAETAGYALTQHAVDWGPFLLRIGFRLVALDSFKRYFAAMGDIAVIDGTCLSGSATGTGHIQGYDGAAWISDFVQAGFWPSAGYRRAEPGFEIYRPRRFD